MSKEPEAHLFCHRCGAVLKPGVGNFYIVKIEAFADPTGPNLTEADLAVDIDEAIEKVRAVNSIIYGNNSKELELGTDINEASVNFTNCLIQLGQSESLDASYFNNCIFIVVATLA